MAESGSDRLDSWKEIAAYLGRSVLTVQRWEKGEDLPVHRLAHGRQDSVYAYRSELDQWRKDRSALRPVRPAERERTQAGASSRIRPVLIVSVLVLVAAAALALWQTRAARVHKARASLALIEQMLREDRSTRTYVRAFELASHAEGVLSADATLANLWPLVSRTIDVRGTPADLTLSLSDGGRADVLTTRMHTPARLRIPRGFPHWRASAEGYEDAHGILDGESGSVDIVLDRRGLRPPEMVRAPGGRFQFGLTHLGERPPFDLPDYWIDAHEVTNRDFKRFVAAGGYEKPIHWKESFILDGRLVSFADAMQHFRDRTGRPGPATWEAGDFPQGKGDYPVTGVSWFEAMAFADFAGKSLPTIFHWVRAAGVTANAEIVPNSNFSDTGLAPAGQYRAIGATGAYDMAGNAKEWCFNEAAGGRFILGGAWNEPIYMFSEADVQPPWLRADTFGFRLVKHITPPSPALAVSVDYPRRDFARERPVSDSAFAVIRGLYSYDRPPLDPRIEAVEEQEQWRTEKVTFNAAYNGERMVAYVFLPRSGAPPYETVVQFPGSAGIRSHGPVTLLQSNWSTAIVKSGRALVWPIFKGTYERSDDLVTDYPARTDFYRQHVLDWYKDLARTLDYVETRKDLDSARIGYYGFSWGARLAPIFLASDPRLKTAVLVSGGLKFAETFPEVDPFNFASRVTVPVLMLNGKYDYFFPVETSQVPLYRLLAARPADKRYEVMDSGHVLPLAPVIRLMLGWYDRYLGVVSHAHRPE